MVTRSIKSGCAVPEVQLVAVADDDPQGLADAAARLKVGKAYADYREMLDKEKPHVVSIAPRWVDKHHELAMACASAASTCIWRSRLSARWPKQTS